MTVLQEAQTKPLAQWRDHGLVALATMVVFAVDLYTPWGVATWILYAFPMFLLCSQSGDRYLYRYAALVTGLIVLDHFFSEAQAPQSFSIFNRAAALVALWTAAWLIAQRERERRALLQCQAGLETAVAERTADLEATNAALRQAERHRREDEARLQAILEHSSDITVVYDENMLVRYANPALKRLLGYELERVIGKPMLAVLHPEDASAAVEAFHKILANPGAIEPREVRLRHKSGHYLWFESVGSEYPGDQGTRGVVVNSRDITAYKDAEKRLIEAHVRQRDALVREVHHRIKNNLQGVIGLLQQHVRAHPGLADPVRGAIAQVNAIATLHGLYAGAETGALCLCDVVEAVGGYMTKLYPEVDLRLERPEHWRKRRLDEREAVAVALIVNELALNAVKACLRERRKDAVRIVLERENENVSVIVFNAMGRLPEGFDFPAGRGLGTGLALAKSLLPPQGASLRITQLAPEGVEAELRLRPPVVLE